MIDFWRKLWQLTRPYKGRFIVGIITGVLSGVAETMVWVAAAVVVGAIFANDEQITRMLEKSPKLLALYQTQQHWLAAHLGSSRFGLVLIASLIPLVILLRGVVNYLNSYLMNWVAIRAIGDLRSRLFGHLMQLPLGFHSRTSTGELMSRLGDVGILQNMIAVSLVTIIREPFAAATSLATAIKVSPMMTLWALLAVPICAVPVAIYNKKVRKAGAANQNEAASLSKVIHEAFTGNRIIKAYNLEGVVAERYQTTLKKYISNYMRVVRATETPGPVIEFIGSVAVVVLLIYFAGKTTPFNFSIFVVAMLSLYKPIKSLVRVNSQLHQTKAATQRVFDLLATPNTMPDPPNPVPLKAAGAEIHFDNVSFAYDNKTVLRDVQLRIKPGQMVALVGNSGGGKTTMTNLLLRFYDPAKGSVKIGGVDIRDVAIADLRSQIAVVTQEVILFNETIGRNIAYGRRNATQADVENAARHAYAHEFIMEKPQGYETPAGERGKNLSGGQQQRVAIARALVKDAPILVLDEATSALDNESERWVQAALDELMKGRTTICIAHRLSTIRNADLIVVMENGQIVEMGRHEELLEQGGVYHKLHSLGMSTGRFEAAVR